MGKPKAPSPPDPQAVAAAQTASNVETAEKTSQLAKNNIYGPNGSLQWIADPEAPGGYKQVTTLSPEQQELLAKNNALSSGLLSTAQTGLHTVDEMMSHPLDTSKLNPLQTSVAMQGMERAAAPGQLQQLSVDPTMGKMVGPAAQAQGVGDAERMGRVSAGMLPQYERMNDPTGIQKDLNYSKLGALPTASDATRQRVEDALYARQTARLDPQFQQEQAALSTKLSNMGIPLGSRAHQQAMQEFADARERAYSGARNDAITMGGAEQSRLINDQLGIRSAGQREVENSGTFHNAAQGQGFNEELAAINQRNTAAGQGLTDSIAATNQNNQAKQQDFQNQFNAVQQRNAAGQQNFNNDVTGTTTNNATGDRYFGQSVTANAANNAATSGNNAAALAVTGQHNAAAQQENANAVTNANLNNQTHVQGYQEAVDAYNRPLTTINALRTGNQPMLPQFSLTQGGPSVAPTDIAGIQNQGYANQLGAYNANAAKNQFLPSIAGNLGGAYIGGL